MAEEGTKKRKMGERRETDSGKNASSKKWPLIKPKKNLQINRLKDTDLFTVRFPFLISLLYICPDA